MPGTEGKGKDTGRRGRCGGTRGGGGDFEVLHGLYGKEVEREREWRRKKEKERKMKPERCRRKSFSMNGYIYLCTYIYIYMYIIVCKGNETYIKEGSNGGMVRRKERESA
jgi:hypothetical protein